MSLDEGITRVSDKMVSYASTTLDRRSSRRGFLIRASLVGSAMMVAPHRFLLRPESAFAVTTCTSCTSGVCFTSHNSAFCCTLTNGTNNCPANTDPCGWWRCCIPTSYCQSGFKYFIDCCGCTGAGACALDSCGNRRYCCYDQEWTNCTPTHGTRIRCRIVRCANPGGLFGNCTSQIFTESSCCQGSDAAGCAGTVAGPHPNCCDTCLAC
ncbi:MAG: hypothetical protein QOD08_1721 [Gaiellaceae bacterium]|jgi:hypothetical protein|nr:hypothetical protein [Gaiellaceae bacterium]